MNKKPSKLCLEMCIIFLYASLVINYLFKQNILHREVELGLESFQKLPFKISKE
jgi:hypothetical protein